MKQAGTISFQFEFRSRGDAVTLSFAEIGGHHHPHHYLNQSPKIVDVRYWRRDRQTVCTNYRLKLEENFYLEGVVRAVRGSHCARGVAGIAPPVFACGGPQGRWTAWLVAPIPRWGWHAAAQPVDTSPFQLFLPLKPPKNWAEVVNDVIPQDSSLFAPEHISPRT